MPPSICRYKAQPPAAPLLYAWQDGQIMTIVYKAVHNAAPEYICDLIESKQSKYSLRSLNGINLRERRPHLKTCGDRAFSVCVRLNFGTLFHQKLGLRKLFIFLKTPQNTLFQTCF